MYGFPAGRHRDVWDDAQCERAHAADHLPVPGQTCRCSGQRLAELFNRGHRDNARRAGRNRDGGLSLQASPMTLVQRQQLFSYMLADQFAWMKAQGLLWTLGDAWRSTDELLCPHCATGSRTRNS